MLENKQLLADKLQVMFSGLEESEFDVIKDPNVKNHWLNEKRMVLNYYNSLHKSIPKQDFFSFGELYMFFSKLTESKNFIITEEIKEMLLNTDVEIKKQCLPFDSIFLDCDIKIKDDIYIKGLLLSDNTNGDSNFLISFLLYNKRYDDSMFCNFFAEESDILSNRTLSNNVNEMNPLLEIYYNIDFRKQITFFCLSFLKLLYHPEVEICIKEYSPVRIKRKLEQNKYVANHHYLKITGRLREYIDNLDIDVFKKEYLKHTNSWVVRGFYKRLSNDRYVNKKFQEVYVMPHIRGVGKPINKDYIVGNKIIWKNQMHMINILKNKFNTHIVLTNTRGVLNGLELDCYIPELKLAFEYNGKQHYEYVERFHKTHNAFKEQINRDKEKVKLCKELGIKLIIIDYTEEICDELIAKKLLNYVGHEIVSIEEVDNINMYDLHVEDNNNFFLDNDLFSKNSGKTWKLLTIVQGFHELNFKVIHMFGGKRSENTWWCFPSEETKLWRDFEISVGALSKPGPKEYEVNLLYPMFSTQLPAKVPDLKPRIRSKIFTIPLKSITLQHISLVVGDISNRGKAIYQTIQKNTDKYSNGADIEFLFNTILKKHKDNSMYTLFFKPLIENNLLGSDYDVSNLNMEEECNNKKAITVLCHDFLPKEFQYFIMGYMMTTMMDLINKDKIPKKNIAMFNEVSMFMKVTDKSAENEVTTQIFRNLITDVARYARSGLFFAFDSQSNAEVRGLIEGADDLLAISEMPSQGDREELCLPLKKDLRMNSMMIRYIATMPINQLVIVQRGDKAKLIKNIMPPRTQCWKQGHNNFYSYWKQKYGDNYKSAALEVDLMKDIYTQRTKKLQEDYDNRVKKALEEYEEKNFNKGKKKPTPKENNITETEELDIENDDSVNPDTDNEENEVISIEEREDLILDDEINSFKDVNSFKDIDKGVNMTNFREGLGQGKKKNTKIVMQEEDGQIIAKEINKTKKEIEVENVKKKIKELNKQINGPELDIMDFNI